MKMYTYTSVLIHVSPFFLFELILLLALLFFVPCVLALFMILLRVLLLLLFFVGIAAAAAAAAAVSFLFLSLLLFLLLLFPLLPSLLPAVASDVIRMRVRDICFAAMAPNKEISLKLTIIN